MYGIKFIILSNKKQRQIAKAKAKARRKLVKKIML